MNVDYECKSILSNMKILPCKISKILCKLYIATLLLFTPNEACKLKEGEFVRCEYFPPSPQMCKQKIATFGEEKKLKYCFRELNSWFKLIEYNEKHKLKLTKTVRMKKSLKQQNC